MSMLNQGGIFVETQYADAGEDADTPSATAAKANPKRTFRSSVDKLVEGPVEFR